MDGRGLTGSRIRERRLALGLKQATLAQTCGISSSYLNLIEHNRRRIGGKLLLRLASALAAEPGTLSRGADTALLEDLTEAAAMPVEAQIETREIEEFAGRYPGWAALVAAQKGRIAELERSLEALNDRMAHDPFLSASMHDVLSTVTAIRSASSILADDQTVDPEWQARFHRNIFEDSQRLTEASQRLVSYLDAGLDTQAGLITPEDELADWLDSAGPALAEAEAEGAAGDGEVGVLTRMPKVQSSSGQALVERFLESYRADAASVPLPELKAIVTEHGLDPAALAQAFGVDLLVMMRRLATVPNGHLPQPLGLVMCDASGALTFRKPISGFALPRFGAACPLLPLYTALSRPGVPVRQIISQGRLLQQSFQTFSVARARAPFGFDGPQVIEAAMLIVPLPAAQPAEGQAVIPVGPACRICPQAECPARREPSVLTAASAQ